MVVGRDEFEGDILMLLYISNEKVRLILRASIAISMPRNGYPYDVITTKIVSNAPRSFTPQVITSHGPSWCETIHTDTV